MVARADPVATDTQTASLARDIAGDEAARTVSTGQALPAWSVTASGAFTYSVDIEIPEGRHAVQPKLALAYSSQAGGGLAGMGWTLTGLPVIQRVNTGSGVQYQGADSYAVNDNGWPTPPNPTGLLVPLTDGSGAFHTRGETWGDYRPQGTCGDGPCYWQVRDGHGNTYYYGGDANALPSANGQGAALWERFNGVTSCRGITVWGLYHAPSGHDVTTFYADDYEVREDSASGGTTETTVYVRALGHVVAAITAGYNYDQPAAPSPQPYGWALPFYGTTTDGMADGTWYYLDNHLGSTAVVLGSDGHEVTRSLYPSASWRRATAPGTTQLR
jgi:hypothetical protein